MSEACPFCGADKKSERLWQCGTWIDKSGGFVRDIDCYRQQLSNKDELLRRALAAIKLSLSGESEIGYVKIKAKHLAADIEAELGEAREK